MLSSSMFISDIIIFWKLCLIHLFTHRMPLTLSQVPLFYAPLAPYTSLSLSTPYYISIFYFNYYFPSYPLNSWKVETASYSL